MWTRVISAPKLVSITNKKVHIDAEVCVCVCVCVCVHVRMRACGCMCHVQQGEAFPQQLFTKLKWSMEADNVERQRKRGETQKGCGRGGGGQRHGACICTYAVEVTGILRGREPTHNDE